MKYAAYVGNKHAAARVTPFFDSIPEARAAASTTDHGDTWVAPCSNWQEHMKWNCNREGMYASMPVTE